MRELSTVGTTVSLVSEQLKFESDSYNFDFSKLKKLRKVKKIGDIYRFGKTIGEGMQGNVIEVYHL